MAQLSGYKLFRSYLTPCKKSKDSSLTRIYLICLFHKSEIISLYTGCYMTTDWGILQISSHFVHERSICSLASIFTESPWCYFDNRLTSSVLRNVTSSSFSVCKVLSSFEISLMSSVKRLTLLSLFTNSMLLYSISASSWRILSSSLSFSCTTLRRSEPSSAAWRLNLPTCKKEISTCLNWRFYQTKRDYIHKV